MKYVSEKLRKSAQGQTCTMRIGNVCNHNPETVVLCHFPTSLKGMGNKSPDFFAGFGCSACHAYFDENRLSDLEKQLVITQSLFETWKFWINNGYITIPITQKRTKPLTKVTPRRKIYG